MPFPWQAKKAKRRSSDNPREQFRALGVADTYFDRLADGKPMTADERESLLRIMFRLRIFPAFDLHRLALDPELLDKAIQQPKDYRGALFRLRGRVEKVIPLEPSPDAAERYELKTYYACWLKLDSPKTSALVFTETVPKRWRKGASPDSAGGALGVFLKLDATDRPIFAAPRLAWYPDNLLGRLGMDVGLLDTVEHQKRLTEQDSPAFYAMLAAVGRAKPGELVERAEENLPKVAAERRWTDPAGRQLYSVVPLFNKPKKEEGQLVALRGTARLVEEVHVTDPDIVAQYGIDHYYELMLFTEDSQGNPLTFCVRELPKGMPVTTGPRYGESVLVAGFFFKTWGYDVRRSPDEVIKPGESKTRIQLSPLLIGRSVVWRPPPPPASQTRTNVIIGVLFIAGMLVVWLVAWRSTRREHRWVDQALGGPPKLDNLKDQDLGGQG